MSHSAIIVTGGSTGIGAAVCRRFLAAGITVINLSRRPLQLADDNLHNRLVDLADRAATAAAAERAAREFDVSGLVHNAGLIRPAPLEDVALADFDHLSQVHLGAAISLAQAVLPGMKRRRFGRIVLITSRAALGLQSRTCYTATKAGMVGMARTWALELGAHGITVNTVAPGPVQDTEMFESAIPADSGRIPALAASIPVRRLGRCADVAHAVAFFADPAAGFITGQTLMVCGGSSLGSLAL